MDSKRLFNLRVESRIENAHRVVPESTLIW